MQCLVKGWNKISGTTLNELHNLYKVRALKRTRTILGDQSHPLSGNTVILLYIWIYCACSSGDDDCLTGSCTTNSTSDILTASLILDFDHCGNAGGWFALLLFYFHVWWCDVILQKSTSKHDYLKINHTHNFMHSKLRPGMLPHTFRPCGKSFHSENKHSLFNKSLCKQITNSTALVFVCFIDSGTTIQKEMCGCKTYWIAMIHYLPLFVRRRKKISQGYA